MTTQFASIVEFLEALWTLKGGSLLRFAHRDVTFFLEILGDWDVQFLCFFVNLMTDSLLHLAR